MERSLLPSSVVTERNGKLNTKNVRMLIREQKQSIFRLIVSAYSLFSIALARKPELGWTVPEESSDRPEVMIPHSCHGSLLIRVIDRDQANHSRRFFPAIFLTETIIFDREI